jgi:hypothetical protein
MPVDLERVAVYDFPIEFRGDGQGQIAFPGPGWSNHRNQGLLPHVSDSRSIASGLVLFSGHGHLSDTCHETPLYNKRVVFGSNWVPPGGRKKAKIP